MDDTFIHRIVYQKARSEVGTLKEQLARLTTAADGPETPTVPLDSEDDCQLELCLKELPSEEEVNAAAVKKSAEGAARVRVMEELVAPELQWSEAAAQDQLIPTKEPGAVSSIGLPALGTMQVQVWDVGAHATANAVALEDW